MWSAMVMLMVGKLFKVEGGELVVGYYCARVWAPDIFGWRLYIQTREWGLRSGRHLAVLGRATSDSTSSSWSEFGLREQTFKRNRDEPRQKRPTAKASHGKSVARQKRRTEFAALGSRVRRREKHWRTMRGRASHMISESQPPDQAPSDSKNTRAWPLTLG